MSEYIKIFFIPKLMINPFLKTFFFTFQSHAAIIFYLYMSMQYHVLLQA